MPNCKTVVPYRGTPEQEERLKRVIEAHRGQPGATMPVLQAAQEIFGYLPEEVQIMVAEGLDGEVSDLRLPGHRLLREGGRRHPQRRGAEAGHRPRRHHRRREVLPGLLPLRGRLRPGPRHDDQQRRLRPPDPRSGGGHPGPLRVNTPGDRAGPP